MSLKFIDDNILAFSENESIFTKIINLDQESFPFPWAIQKWRELSALISGYRLLALIDSSDDLLGFILYEIYENFEEDEIRLNSYIHKIVTVSQKRGTGLGQALMAQFKELLLAANCLSVYLDVQGPNHQAIRFYEKSGFKKLFLKNKFYSNGDNSFYCLMSLCPI